MLPTSLPDLQLLATTNAAATFFVLKLLPYCSVYLSSSFLFVLLQPPLCFSFTSYCQIAWECLRINISMCCYFHDYICGIHFSVFLVYSYHFFLSLSSLYILHSTPFICYHLRAFTMCHWFATHFTRLPVASMLLECRLAICVGLRSYVSHTLLAELITFIVHVGKRRLSENSSVRFYIFIFTSCLCWVHYVLIHFVFDLCTRYLVAQKCYYN